ncbi:hypothetical protein JEZ13_07745 [bacterium]|nr:hypothetical protein [bacterium]
MHLKATEIRAAMTANSINSENLLDYVNEKTGLDISLNYLNRIISGNRSNQKVEKTIEDLFGPWIQGAIRSNNQVQFNEIQSDREMSDVRL